MILISYGTRPEWIKIQPILKNLQSGYQLLFTGQHTDLIPDAEYDWELPFENVSESRLDDIVINVLTWLDQAFHIVGEIDYVMVHGDTTSAMAVAMAAFHREIPVIHLEAGLRTYDLKNPYPEEFNRIMIDKIAEIYFCPTMMNADNIFAERNGNSEFELFVTGNTVIDALLEFAPETTKYDNKILITLHRRENHHQIRKYFEIISRLATDNPDLEFVLPIHPNPNVKKHSDVLKNVKVIDPIPYDEMIQLMANCKFIISDSGGIQEEAAYLDKKVIVCRETTERPESLDVHSFLCKSPDDLEELFYKINDDYEITAHCPFGDGTAGKTIAKILEKL